MHFDFIFRRNFPQKQNKKHFGILIALFSSLIFFVLKGCCSLSAGSFPHCFRINYLLLYVYCIFSKTLFNILRCTKRKSWQWLNNSTMVRKVFKYNDGHCKYGKFTHLAKKEDKHHTYILFGKQTLGHRVIKRNKDVGSKWLVLYRKVWSLNAIP